MSSERLHRRLIDIINNIDRAPNYIGGLSLEDFREDDMRLDAVERCLQRITEATIKIGPDDMRMIAPDLPADQVRAMGNVLRHEYDRINAEVVYNTIINDLPSLRSACAVKLAEIAKSDNAGGDEGE